MSDTTTEPTKEALSEPVLSEVDKLKHDLELAAQIGKHLLEENNNLKAENAELKSKVESFDSHHDHHFALETAANKERELEHEKDILEKTVSELESKYSLTLNELKLNSIRFQDVQQRLQLVENELAMAKRKLSVQEEALDTASSTRDQYDNLTTEFAEAKSREQQLSKENQALREKLESQTEDSSEQSLQKLSEEMEQLKADHQNLKKELQSKNTRIEQLEQTGGQLDSLRTTIDDLNENVKELTDENTFLHQQLDAKTKIIETKDRLIESREKMAKHQRQLSTTPSASPARTQSLRNELSESGDGPTSAAAATAPAEIDSDVEEVPLTPRTQPAGSRDTSSLEKTPPMSPSAASAPNPRMAMSSPLPSISEASELRQIPVFSLPSSPSPPVIQSKEGWLIKQGGFIRNWKRRWFYVKSGSLFYCVDIKSRFTPQGAIFLKEATINKDTVIPDRPHAFSIKCPNRVYLIHADTAQDKREWVEFLEQKIEELNTPSGITRSRSASVGGFAPNPAALTK